MSRLKVQLRCHDCSKSVLVDADAFIETLQKLIEALEQHMKINREYHINIPDNVDPTYTFRCDDCARSHDEWHGFR